MPLKCLLVPRCQIGSFTCAVQGVMRTEVRAPENLRGARGFRRIVVRMDTDSSALYPCSSVCIRGYLNSVAAPSAPGCAMCGLSGTAHELPGLGLGPTIPPHGEPSYLTPSRRARCFTAFIGPMAQSAGDCRQPIHESAPA